MYQRGLRPFQPVLYVSQHIKDQLNWRNGSLFDLQHFAKISELLSDEDILSYLLLNDNSEKKKTSSILPNPVGIETILSQWQREVNQKDNVKLQDDLNRITDQLKILNKDSALEDCLETLSYDYEIVHDENVIYIVLNKNAGDDNSQNLLDIRKTNMVRDIVRSVIKTYCLYYTYHDACKTPWFVDYIDQL